MHYLTLSSLQSQGFASEKLDLVSQVYFKKFQVCKTIANIESKLQSLWYLSYIVLSFRTIIFKKIMLRLF